MNHSSMPSLTSHDHLNKQQQQLQSSFSPTTDLSLTTSEATPRRKQVKLVIIKRWIDFVSIHCLSVCPLVLYCVLQGYVGGGGGAGDVVSDLNSSRTPFITKQYSSIGINGDSSSRRVVLISSKSHGSDWDLTTTSNTTTIDGQESEDSGFQIDVDSTINKTATADMIVTTNKVFISY